MHTAYALDATCAAELRVGGNGDGGKWVCAPGPLLRAAGPKCLVYSFGSRLSFDFEDAIHAIAPWCEVHVFDPTPSIADKISASPSVVPSYIHFHTVGLAGPGAVVEIENKRVTVRSLDEIVEQVEKVLG